MLSQVVMFVFDFGAIEKMLRTPEQSNLISLLILLKAPIE
jgi:hypothetical protein